MPPRISIVSPFGGFLFAQLKTKRGPVGTLIDLFYQLNSMPKEIPKTRYHLQKLTRRINRLESLKPFSYPSSGTGVKAAAREMGSKYRLKKKTNELKQERALVKAGLLEIEQKGYEALYRLTNDGLVQVLKDRIVLEKNELFGEEQCFVTFDIPEDVNKTRRAFRRFLKKAGFEKLQQSVWVSHKRIADSMKQLIEALGIQKWAAVIVGENIQSKSVPTGP
jgi:virulence-associated protein VapD